MTGSVTGLTARLADHVAEVANATLGEDDVEVVRRLLLDNLVVSLWGSSRPAVREIADWSRRFAGTGDSRVLGRPWRTEPSTAALVHGMASHAYELDDTHDVTTSHPGCVIIPAALAVAAEIDASRGDLHCALAAGYEAMALIGTAAGGLDTVHRGFHPTPVYGVFGAAAAVVALRAAAAGRAVDPKTLLAAWGHALSQASGSMQFSVESTGGEVKRLHAGLAARNGILAADYAELPSVTAPRLSVEGRYGVAASFGGDLSDPAIGSRLQIHVISFKPYSCCRLFHSTIDALRQVTDGFSVPPEELVDILVTGPRLIEEQHMTTADSTMTAQYSCPYIVGATLAYGPERYDAYGEAFLRDPRILETASKVRFEVDSDLEKRYFPEHFATGVRVRFRDGRERSAVVVDSAGTIEHPLSTGEILAKGAGLAALGCYPSGDELMAAVWDDATHCGPLADLLASQG